MPCSTPRRLTSTIADHPPTSRSLLAEVYHQDVEELVAAAPTLLQRHQPLEALALWFDRVADYAQVKRGVFAAVEVACPPTASDRSATP
jgi:hypothetical protein